MKKYKVGITIINCFDVEAESADEAEDKVRGMTDKEILTDSDFSINYKDEITGEKD